MENSVVGGNGFVYSEVYDEFVVLKFRDGKIVFGQNYIVEKIVTNRILAKTLFLSPFRCVQGVEVIFKNKIALTLSLSSDSSQRLDTL